MSSKWLEVLSGFFFAVNTVSAQATAESISLKLSTIICYFIIILFAIAPLIAVIMIVLNGIKWMTSAEDKSAREKAKDGIIHAIIGLIVVTLAVAIVSMVGGDSLPIFKCFPDVLSSVGMGPETGSYVATTTVLQKIRYSRIIYLKEGWNLMSTPLVLENPTIVTVLAGINYDSIYTWNVTKAVQTGDGWMSYVRGKGGDLREIETDRGYWLKVNEPAALILTGTKPETPRMIHLYPGWNFVGLSSLDTVNINNTLYNIKYSGVYGWNATLASADPRGVGWVVYSTRIEPAITSIKPYTPSGMGRVEGIIKDYITSFEPGKGYWIYVNEEGYWIID